MNTTPCVFWITGGGTLPVRLTINCFRQAFANNLSAPPGLQKQGKTGPSASEGILQEATDAQPCSPSARPPKPPTVKAGRLSLLWCSQGSQPAQMAGTHPQQRCRPQLGANWPVGHHQQRAAPRPEGHPHGRPVQQELVPGQPHRAAAQPCNTPKRIRHNKGVNDSFLHVFPNKASCHTACCRSPGPSHIIVDKVLVVRVALAATILCSTDSQELQGQ